jgi:hypothetical protein
MALLIPNAQNPPVYPGQAVADETDWQILFDGLQGTGVVSGCAQTGLSLTVTGCVNTGTAVTITYSGGNGGVIPNTSSITVAGITGFTTNNPNGTWSVTGGSANTVQFTATSAPTGSYSSGGTITGMVVAIASGTVAISGVEYSPAAAYVAIAAASGYDRRDLISYASGGYTSTSGTQTATGNYPVKAPVPASSCGISEVYVVGTALGSASTVITGTGNPPTGNLTDKTCIITPSIPSSLVAKTNSNYTSNVYTVVTTDSPNTLTFSNNNTTPPTVNLPSASQLDGWHVNLVNLGVSVAVTGYSFSTPTVTLTVASATALPVGTLINVSGLGGITGATGLFWVTGSTATSVSYSASGASGTYTSGGTIAAQTQMAVSPNGLNLNGSSGSYQLGYLQQIDVKSDGTNYWFGTGQTAGTMGVSRGTGSLALTAGTTTSTGASVSLGIGTWLVIGGTSCASTSAAGTYFFRSQIAASSSGGFTGTVYGGDLFTNMSGAATQPTSAQVSATVVVTAAGTVTANITPETGMPGTITTYSTVDLLFLVAVRLA